MRSNFDLFLSEVLKHEGGYVNHPKDPGGPTNLGVTLGTAKRLGIDVDGDGDTDIIDIKKLRREDAAKVFKVEYWDKVRGDDLPSGVDIATGDFAVNSGVSRSAIFLQELVGVAPDGKIGPLTIAAVQRLDPVKVVNAMCDKRMAFLKRLSTFQTFGKGWTARVSAVRDIGVRLAKSAPAATTIHTKAPTSVSGAGEGNQIGDTKPRGWMALIAVAGPLIYGVLKFFGIAP